MTVNALPLSLISDEWYRRLRPMTTTREVSMLLWDTRMPGNYWDLRLPEGVGSMRRPTSFRFIVHQPWRIDEAGDWGYSHTSWQRLNSHKEAISFPGEVSCRTRRLEDGLAVELTLRNADEVDWRSAYAWVCMPHKTAPDFSPRTWLRMGGQFVPYQEACPRSLGPAGMRILTEHGLEERRRLEAEGLALGEFAEARACDGLRCATGEVGGRPCVAGIASPHATIAGGFDDNPCTDLALGFGDVPARGRASVRLVAYFLVGTLEDFAARVSATDWEGLF